MVKPLFMASFGLK